MRIHTHKPQQTFRLLQEIDWKKHPLGDMEKWDSVLVQFLNFIFNSHQPCFIFWGKEPHCFYNDGYIPILGRNKHPTSLGAPANEVWKEVWSIDTNPQYISAMRGDPTWNVDRMVPIERNGEIHEAFFTYGYSPLFDEKGAVKGVIVTALETTSTVVAKRNLDQTAEQLSRALEVLGIGFFDWDIPKNFVIFNQKMKDDWGIKADVPLLDVIKHVHPDDQELVMSKVQNAIDQNSLYSCTYRIIKNGKVEWIDARGLVSYEDGKAVRFFGTSIVVTQKVLDDERIETTTRELLNEQQKLKAIFDSAPAALATWAGEELIFEKVNPLYQKIFPGRQLEGLSILEAIPELKGQGFDDLLREVLHTGVPYIGNEVEALIPDENGVLQKRYYDFSYVQLRDSNGVPTGIFDHAIEVTDRVLATLEREEEKNLRETFVSAMTHDLRTPLTAAKMSAQLLMRMDDPLKKQQYLNRIVNNMNRADEMIRDLLDANRMKAGEMIPIEKKPLELNTTVSTIVHESASIHGDRFRFNGTNDINGQWDEIALTRIIENLLSNALKYGDPSTPINVGLKRDQQIAELSVENRGSIISPEDQVKIFHPYHRTHDAHKSRQKGWGIGLSLVRALTEAHGGSVHVESTEETGTKFMIRLPIGQE